MSHNEQLLNRVRETLRGQKKVVEKKMFGGITFMVNGKMCVGVYKDDLMARIDPSVYEKALKRKGCHEMRFTGKQMKGFVFVSPEGTKAKKDLEYWVGLAFEFNKVAKASKKQ